MLQITKIFITRKKINLYMRFFSGFVSDTKDKILIINPPTYNWSNDALMEYNG